MSIYIYIQEVHLYEGGDIASSHIWYKNDGTSSGS